MESAPSPPADSPPSENARPRLVDAWPLAIPLAAQVAAGAVELVLLERWSVGWPSPAEEPPWYFIREHATQGITHAVALVVALVAALAAHRVATRPWGRAMAIMAMFFAAITFGGQTLGGLVIFALVGDPFSPEAVSPWLTFDEYLSSPVRTVASYAPIVAAIAVFFATRRRWLPRDQGKTSPK
jgi:hypothetical protein